MIKMSLTYSTRKQEDKSFLSRTGSLTKGLSAMITESTQSVLPDVDLITLPCSEEHRIDMPQSVNEVQKHIKRSLSAPSNLSGDSEKIDSVGHEQIVSCPCDSVNSEIQVNIENEGTNSKEKEVCRICLVDIEEGGELFRMGCSCKGDLALAHQTCAFEWFRVKGNSTCDVCNQKVQNLPANLLKKCRNSSTRDGSQQLPLYRALQDVPVMVLVSMIAYFCLLEQLLVRDLGAQSLALAIPFSCILGLLSSMVASAVVHRNHVWGYASIQFLFVILFAHIMYNMLKVSPVLAVLLSSFIGFGITMSVNSLITEYFTRCARRGTQQQIDTNGQHEQNRENLEIAVEDSASRDRYMQNP